MDIALEFFYNIGAHLPETSGPDDICLPHMNLSGPMTQQDYIDILVYESKLQHRADLIGGGQVRF